MIKSLKQYLFLKKPYSEKRAMVLWSQAYKKRLLTRAQRHKQWNISASSVLLNNSNN